VIFYLYIDLFVCVLKTKFKGAFHQCTNGFFAALEEIFVKYEQIYPVEAFTKQTGSDSDAMELWPLWALWDPADLKHYSGLKVKIPHSAASINSVFKSLAVSKLNVIAKMCPIILNIHVVLLVSWCYV